MTTTTAAAPATTSADVLAEARAAQREELRALASTMIRLMLFGPGIAIWALFLVQSFVRPHWQLKVLFLTSFSMWCSWFWARHLARTDRIERAAVVLYGSVLVHDTAALVLRSGGFGATALASMGTIVIAWLLAPRFLYPACGLAAGSLATARVLDLAGVLPQAPTPPAAQVAMDVTLSLVLLPLIAVVLRRGTRVHELPFRHLEETAGRHLHVLDTVQRVQPELRSLAAHVNESAAGVASSATELAATTHELSRVTAELQALLTQTAAAAAQARAVADGTRRSSAESGDALAVVERELERFLAAMSALTASVGTLSERSAGTEGVIAGVEEVHEAVKILAVNAAIEAARAGEAGRGIGVVATEMRALIGGTEASVRQGRALLGAVRGDAEAAVGRARSAMEDLRDHVEALRRSRALIAEIIASFGETAGAIDTIAAAGEDQRQQVEHVSRAMSEMKGSAEALTRSAADLLAGAERFARAQAEIGALFDGRAGRPAA